jgi:hypothetical protein
LVARDLKSQKACRTKEAAGFSEDHDAPISAPDVYIVADLSPTAPIVFQVPHH